MNKSTDQYILKSAEFAQPILLHLRELVHFACPDTVEAIKWGFPHFTYKGRNLCYMSAFKSHCAFGFWEGIAIKDDDKILEKSNRTAMGQLGRITSLSELPDDDKMIELIRNGMSIIDSGKDKVAKPKSKATEKSVPSDFQKALKSSKEATKHFNLFSISKRNEYIDWIEEAKTEATRNKRIDTSIEWLSEGKSRMWKYEKPK